MKHKEKLKLARRMRIPKEEQSGISIFNTKFWIKRKQAIVDRIRKKLTRNIKLVKLKKVKSKQL